MRKTFKLCNLFPFYDICEPNFLFSLNKETLGSPIVTSVAEYVGMINLDQG